MVLTDAQKVEVGLTPPPGGYVNVRFDDYLRWPYLSKSALSTFALLPDQYMAERDGRIPRKQSDAFDLGTVVDALWVERKSILQAGYIVWSGGKRQGEEWQRFKRAAGKLRIITAKQRDLAYDCVDALDRHSRACELREGATPQVSLVWDCPITGLRLKGRPDLLDFGKRTLLDLKTTRDARPHRVDAQVSEYNYHWQLYLYMQALEVLGYGSGWAPWLIAVRTTPVHAVSCRPVLNDDPGDAPDAIEVARVEVTKQLWRFRHCRLSDEWPASYDDERPVRLPGWRVQRAMRGGNDG